MGWSWLDRLLPFDKGVLRQKDMLTYVDVLFLTVQLLLGLFVLVPMIKTLTHLIVFTSAVVVSHQIHDVMVKNLATKLRSLPTAVRNNFLSEEHGLPRQTSPGEESGPDEPANITAFGVTDQSDILKAESATSREQNKIPVREDNEVLSGEESSLDKPSEMGTEFSFETTHPETGIGNNSADIPEMNITETSGQQIAPDIVFQTGVRLAASKPKIFFVNSNKGAVGVSRVQKKKTASELTDRMRKSLEEKNRVLQEQLHEVYCSSGQLSLIRSLETQNRHLLEELESSRALTASWQRGYDNVVRTMQEIGAEQKREFFEGRAQQRAAHEKELEQQATRHREHLALINSFASRSVAVVSSLELRNKALQRELDAVVLTAAEKERKLVELRDGNGIYADGVDQLHRTVDELRNEIIVLTDAHNALKMAYGSRCLEYHSVLQKLNAHDGGVVILPEQFVTKCTVHLAGPDNSSPLVVPQDGVKVLQEHSGADHCLEEQLPRKGDIIQSTHVAEMMVASTVPERFQDNSDSDSEDGALKLNDASSSSNNIIPISLLVDAMQDDKEASGCSSTSRQVTTRPLSPTCNNTHLWKSLSTPPPQTTAPTDPRDAMEQSSAWAEYDRLEDATVVEDSAAEVDYDCLEDEVAALRSTL